MEDIKNQIFASYKRDTNLFDEIYDEQGNITEIY